MIMRFNTLVASSAMATLAGILVMSPQARAEKTYLPQQSFYTLCPGPRYQAEDYSYSPKVYKPARQDAYAFRRTPLRRNEWSPWEFVDEKCGVELQVRYKMNNNPLKRVESVAQFRYVNKRGRDCAASLQHVHFRLNGGDEIPWAGETVYLGPYSVLEGVRFHMAGDTPLRAIHKCWSVY